MTATTLKPEQALSATRFKVGAFTRDMTTATGTQAVTGVGFLPKGAIFLYVKDQSTIVGLGIDDGTNKESLAHYGATNWTNSASGSIYPQDGSGNDYRGYVQSWDADGFTINWTKVSSPTGTVAVYYLAFR